MAICAECRKPVTSGDMKNAKVIRENGRVKEILHNKCTFVRAKHERMGPTGRYGTPPTAYEQAASHQNADDVTAEARARREQAEAELARLQELATTWAAHPGDVVLTGSGGEATVADLLDAAQADLELARRQEELAAERAREDHRSEIVDWREPTSTDI